MNKYPHGLLKLTNLARPLLALTLATSVLASLSGCAVLLVGGAVGGAMSVSDRRTLGAQTEDTTIELKAGNRISTVFGDAVHVNANSYNRKVLLTGEVKDEATKAQVEKEIGALENVHAVVNEIQVTPFLPSFSSRSADTLTTTKVKAKLVGTSDIYSSSFKITTEAGVVYLMGRVSQREGATAAESIREVSGVQKVVKVFEYIDEVEVKNYQAKPVEEATPTSTSTTN
ncbi:BON domain-containing protein [Solimicrobium silvestre]|uniref:Putative periplasmic or secreted lipoprotein n=1 Tax=Solimicrobium silvestre TaxID=2099400 RepID=A0A2S9GZT6_9BURK|nr:BON domain-containing protein [Solimicrobium silvestre]PRC93241.1 putative periplasmic or secreted lipoprotein [Solimicrobium silvestre]